MMRQNAELYLHIPFCVRKCAYCDFLSFPATEETEFLYVKKLMDKIRAAGPILRDHDISSVFVGGGTPSIIPSHCMVEIFDAVRDSMKLTEDCEISMEANPGTVTKEKLADYKKAGINRLSMGLQSAHNGELAALGRIHTFETFCESFYLAREAGFENISLDLMSALPGQTTATWMDTLKKAVNLDPEHISAYSLIIEEGTPFYEKYGNAAGEKLLPDEDTEREMYHLTKTYLKECGYERYEISNYAKKGRECRHNTGYWTGVPYLGLGLGASSYFGGRRFTDQDDLKTYLTEDPELPGYGELLTEKEKQEEFFFLGLRMTKGVSLEEFQKRFGVSAESVYPGIMERFVEEGAAVLENGNFRLTEYGMDVSNYVMAEFLQD